MKADEPLTPEKLAKLARMLAETALELALGSGGPNSARHQAVAAVRDAIHDVIDSQLDTAKESKPPAPPRVVPQEGEWFVCDPVPGLLIRRRRNGQIEKYYPKEKRWIRIEGRRGTFVGLERPLRSDEVIVAGEKGEPVLAKTRGLQPLDSYCFGGLAGRLVNIEPLSGDGNEGRITALLHPDYDPERQRQIQAERANEGGGK